MHQGMGHGGRPPSRGSASHEAPYPNHEGTAWPTLRTVGRGPPSKMWLTLREMVPAGEALVALEKRSLVNPNTCPLNLPSHNRRWPLEPCAATSHFSDPAPWGWTLSAVGSVSGPPAILEGITFPRSGHGQMGARQSTGTLSVLGVLQATRPRICSAKKTSGHRRGNVATCNCASGTRRPQASVHEGPSRDKAS